jgi:23S rRNA (cytosine1962-C5)-methyltransferase
VQKIILKRKQGTRFTSGHPWVFSNELSSLPKYEAGSWVELRAENGEALSVGYYNPHSLISFRSLGRGLLKSDLSVADFLKWRILTSLRRRSKVGFSGTSFRLAFAEADELPGLIVDAYLHAEERAYVWVFQPATAGAEKLLTELSGLFETFQKLSEEHLALPLKAIVIKRNSQSRTREGLTLEASEICAGSWADADLMNFPVLLQDRLGQNLVCRADLFTGQKTGFFLDQTHNIQLLTGLLEKVQWSQNPSSRPIKILDLCCYVGHWSLQTMRELKRRGIEAEATLFDSSAKALAFAEKNVEFESFRSKKIQADALENLKELEPQSFDLVICDPPALIKSRGGYEAGKRAYVKINTDAMRLLKKGGLFVSSSCSGLLSEEDYFEVLAVSSAKAFSKSELSMQLLTRGGQGADHPVLTGFPEGRYLKCWMGLLS